MENEYRMELRDVSKSFGEVKSLRNVDFKLVKMRWSAYSATMVPENRQ